MNEDRAQSLHVQVAHCDCYNDVVNASTGVYWDQLWKPSLLVLDVKVLGVSIVQHYVPFAVETGFLKPGHDGTE